MATPKKKLKRKETLASDVAYVGQVNFQVQYQCSPYKPFNASPRLELEPEPVPSFGYQHAHQPVHNAFAQYAPSPWTNQSDMSLIQSAYNGTVHEQPGSFVHGFSPQAIAPKPPSAQGSNHGWNLICDPSRHQHFGGPVNVDYTQYRVHQTVPSYLPSPDNLQEASWQYFNPENVCFGMLAKIEGQCGLAAPSTHPIHFTSYETFTSSIDGRLRGKINAGYIHIISALKDDGELCLEASVSIQDQDMTGTRAKGPRSSQPCVINIIIYGPLSMFEEIGSYFEDHDLYLQDPIGCRRNVPYRNPHRISEAPDMPTFTSGLEGRQERLRLSLVTDEEGARDLMNALDSQAQENLAEATPPSSLKTPLKRHQKKALTFMLQREMGWALDGSRPDMWEAVKVGSNERFINRISGEHQSEKPPPFYGGIIADPMGLGKTLTMIALIASDPGIDNGNSASLSPTGLHTASHCTLVIVPPSLLGTWEEQIDTHVHSNRLPWCLHYSKDRITQEKLKSVVIVLTTYQTVVSDCKSRDAGNVPLLFRTKWRRLVLDEAHLVRNNKARMAGAVRKLDSLSRWAVTGTPIQNKLSDLAALLIFIRAHPYSQKNVFESDISHLWKSGEWQEAVARLKRMAGFLILRRAKEIIELPPRHDRVWKVDISAPERKLYEEIKKQAVKKIKQALAQNENPNDNDAVSFVNVLQRIEALRMVCNLGLRYTDRHKFAQEIREDPYDAQQWSVSAQKLFNIRRGATLPTKVSLLVHDLLNLPGDTKSVVFSSWRKTLDVVEVGLRQAEIPYLRFDGKIPLKQRQDVLNTFRKNTSMKVLVLTLSCGAVGITLTQASRAYLMEPHWNPTMEDQALARIHRLGQTKEVTTIRFSVNDSIEERIKQLQESKRDLANVLNPQTKNGAEISTRLQWLDELLG